MFLCIFETDKGSNMVGGLCVGFDVSSAIKEPLCTVFYIGARVSGNDGAFSALLTTRQNCHVLDLKQKLFCDGRMNL